MANATSAGAAWLVKASLVWGCRETIRRPQPVMAYDQIRSCGIFFSGPTTGKWCSVVLSSDVDVAWTKVRVAVEEDKLLCAKVSTSA